MADLVQIAGEGARVEPGSDQPIPVPSGQSVTRIETIWNVQGPDGAAVRFRFLAPAIAREGGTIDAQAAQDDMLALCRSQALDQVRALGDAAPGEIIISLSDRPLPFGETHPEATQYFGSFVLEDGDCVWSLF